MSQLIPLDEPVLVYVSDLGQVGAGQVVDFIPRDGKRVVSLPRNARPGDLFAEFEVCGDSLEGKGIFDGYVLLCRKNFELSEITPDRVVIAQILTTGELLAKSIKANGDGTVSLIAANPKYSPKIFNESEVEIVALAVEFKSKI